MTSSLSVAWGGAPVIGGGGVMSNATGAHDPSVGDYADTSPASLGREMRGDYADTSPASLGRRRASPIN